LWIHGHFNKKEGIGGETGEAGGWIGGRGSQWLS
jgi:hypothetical protein